MSGSQPSVRPTAASSRPRLLVVSATYVTEENRKKLAALALHFDVTCATCAELTAYGLPNRVDPARPGDGYRLVGLPAVGQPSSTTRYWLRGLGRVFRRCRPDMVLVESEPWPGFAGRAGFAKRCFAAGRSSGNFPGRICSVPAGKG